MDIINNIIPILFIIGLIQGIISGVILIYLNLKKNRSTLYLGIFVLAFSIDYITPISELLNITIQYPQLKFLFDFRWLMFPLFYLYVRQVSILPKSRVMYLYLLPWLIMFTISLLNYFMEIKSLWEPSLFNMFYYKGSNIFDIFMAIKTVLFINKHSLETQNQYSSTKLKELKWAKIFVISGICFVLVMQIRLAIKNYHLDLFEVIVNVGFLYWVSIHGIRQRNIEPLILVAENDREEIQIEDKNNPKKQITKEDIELVEKVELYLLNEKEYLKPDLTIADVSKYINEHPKRVSLAINIVTKKNFKSYINSYRVAEAKRLLENKFTANYSIDAIGLEVGFKSKSVFYSAFKKETGLTPHNFKIQN